MAQEFVSSTEYNLKWNSHNSTILSMLDSLLERESLVDVTLAAEGKFINVHRFMLYACSPYFEELLTQQPKKQAIIFLKDVTFANLQALIHFMYKGEVLIPEDQLGSFCQTAVSLKIKGLLFCDKEESVKVKSNAVHSSVKSNTRYTSPPKTKFNKQSPPSSPVCMQPLARKSIPRVENPTSPLNHTELEQMTLVNGMHEVNDDVPIIERRKRTITRDEDSTFNGKKQQMIDAEEQVTVAAISNRKVKPVAAKSQTPSSDFFESAPTTPQDPGQLESNLENEQQYDTADNDSIAQEDNIEMYYSQDETMHANNNGTTSSRRSSRKTKSSMSNGKLVRSRRYSASTPMHVCGKCGRSYSYKGSLITHMADCGKTSQKTPRK